MLTQILMDSGVDPTAVIGGKLPRIGGYGRVGNSDTMVCESCEFSDHFLKLHPDIAVILNVDEDHLDYFKTLENIIRSFRTFAGMATKLVIYNGDDENTRKAVEDLDKKEVTFGFSETNDYYPLHITPLGGTRQSFDLYHKGDKLTEIRLNVAGRHNVLDAVAACAAALSCGVLPKQLYLPLSEFNGAGRRFELLGEVNGITIMDDYAHHPAELRVTLEAAKSLISKRFGRFSSRLLIAGPHFYLTILLRCFKSPIELSFLKLWVLARKIPMGFILKISVKKFREAFGLIHLRKLKTMCLPMLSREIL